MGRSIERLAALTPSSCNAELGESVGNRLSLCFGTDLFVDVFNPAVDPYVESPAGCKRLIFVDDAVRLRRAFGRIAEERVVEAKFLRELPVRFRGIDADGEKRGVEPTDLIAALTERPAFGRSAAGESFGEPREHDGPFALVVREPIGDAVGPGEGERGRRIADLEFDGSTRSDQHDRQARPGYASTAAHRPEDTRFVRIPCHQATPVK